VLDFFNTHLTGPVRRAAPDRRRLEVMERA
jgi:hypothetical protein